LRELEVDGTPEGKSYLRELEVDGTPEGKSYLRELEVDGSTADYGCINPMKPKGREEKWCQDL